MSVRALVAAIFPRGHPLAIEAAVQLCQSGGGEGEAEEAADLRAVDAGLVTLSLLGPGEGHRQVIARLVQRMASCDAPLRHLPLLAAALHAFVRAPPRVCTFAAKWWRFNCAAKPDDLPLAEEPVDGIEQHLLHQKLLASARATLHGVRQEIACMVEALVDAHRRVHHQANMHNALNIKNALNSSSHTKNALKTKNALNSQLSDGKARPDDLALLRRNLQDHEIGKVSAKGLLADMERRGEVLFRELFQVLCAGCWVYSGVAGSWSRVQDTTVQDNLTQDNLTQDKSSTQEHHRQHHLLYVTLLCLAWPIRAFCYLAV